MLQTSWKVVCEREAESNNVTMILDVCRFLLMPHDQIPYASGIMLPNAPQCFPMLPNASQCFPMLPNAQPVMVPDHSLASLYHRLNKQP
jgi:hypothetical protein